MVNGSQVNVSSSIGNTNPEPIIGMPFDLNSLSCGGRAAKICSFISSVKCSASSHPAVINACPGLRLLVKFCTTSVMPDSGVKVK